MFFTDAERRDRGLAGKCAIVTGAAAHNGIGFAIAARLAQAGVDLMITDCDAAGIAQREADLRAVGASVEGRVHDVTARDSWEAICAAAQARWAGLDFLVNNAGVLKLAALENIEATGWRHLLSVNLSGPLLGMQCVAPLMRAHGGGAIVNMCSVSGILGTPNAGAYSASKGGLRALTQCAAIDLAPSGIRVNSVHPGFIQTNMQAGAAGGVGEEAYASALASVPARRFGTPDDVAGGVLFLLSDDADYVTGTELRIDGGLSCTI